MAHVKPTVSNTWKEVFEVIGVHNVPRLPFYFGSCPHCNHKLRFMEDFSYRDGWWGCETCNIGGHPVEFAANFLNINYEQLNYHFKNKAYFKRAIKHINIFAEHNQNLNNVLKNAQPIFANVMPHFQVLGVPRITSQAAAERIGQHAVVITSKRRIQKYFNYRTPQRYKDSHVWTIKCPEGSRHKTQNQPDALAVKCMNTVGRLSGFTLCSARGDIGYCVLDSFIRPGVITTYFGFTFGAAIWGNTVFKHTFKNNIFVVPVAHALQWQLTHLQESAQLLPVVAYQCVPQKASLTNVHTHGSAYYWKLWPDKHFIFWAPTVDNYFKKSVRDSNGSYLVGKLPNYLQEASIKQKLDYIFQNAQKYKGEWNDEDLS